MPVGMQGPIGVPIGASIWGSDPNYLKPTTRTVGGVTVYDRARAFPGYTLAATYLPEHSDQFDAYLLDMDGKVVHRWNASARRIFPENPIAQRPGGPGMLEIHGVHLYDNGDLVVSLGGQGAAKLDRCGQVLWRITNATHHHVEPLPDGSVLIPDHVKRYAEQADRPRVGLGPSGFYLDDRLLHIDRDGHVINEKSVIDILFESGWESLLFSGPGRSKMVQEEDPTHLNDVEALPAEMASAFPMFNAGDLMMSFRHLNTVLVVEPKNWHVKWAMTGPWLMQHDPDFLPNGHILVYDNRVTGAKPVLGNTRLVEVDPATKQIVRIFEGKGEEAFYASERGEQQRLPNGNLLLVDPFGGRLVGGRSGLGLPRGVGVGEPRRARVCRHDHRHAEDRGSSGKRLGRSAMRWRRCCGEPVNCLRRASARYRRFLSCQSPRSSALGERSVTPTWRRR